MSRRRAREASAPRAGSSFSKERSIAVSPCSTPRRRPGSAMLAISRRRALWVISTIASAAPGGRERRSSSHGSTLSRATSRPSRRRRLSRREASACSGLVTRRPLVSLLVAEGFRRGRAPRFFRFDRFTRMERRVEIDLGKIQIRSGWRGVRYVYWRTLGAGVLRRSHGYVSLLSALVRPQ